MIYLKKKHSKAILFFLIIFIFLSNTPVVGYADESEKVVYLTFDDGPGGKVTKDVLDILKSEQVPATFFLIGNQIKGQEELVARIHNEGHSLGLHSMTHNKNKLYSNNQNFLKEMIECQKSIQEACGVTSTILRFPFGCNNDGYHLKKQLVDLLHENNLKIYDWNVDSTDGANHNASPKTFIKRSKSDKDHIILLMHCGYTNKNSVKAVPEIIKYYKERGYKFKAISDDTEEMFRYLK